MGFPGVWHTFDFMADPFSRDYSDKNAVHSRTAVANEVIVHSLAKDEKEFATFGLNPGLIKTDIRRELTGFVLILLLIFMLILTHPHIRLFLIPIFILILQHRVLR